MASPALHHTMPHIMNEHHHSSALIGSAAIPQSSTESANEEYASIPADGLDWMDHGDRSHPDLIRLDALRRDDGLSYPGWESDFRAAEMAHMQGQAIQQHLFRLEESERMFRGDRSHSRLRALDALHLTYPGCDDDILQAEAWHLSHGHHHHNLDDAQDAYGNVAPPITLDSSARRSSDGTHRRRSRNRRASTSAGSTLMCRSVSLSLQYPKMLRGFRNKQLLHMGDESHPHMRELSMLELTYPGWEMDVEAAKTAHGKGTGFDLRYQTILRKQCAHAGDRSHWRLQALDCVVFGSSASGHLEQQAASLASSSDRHEVDCGSPRLSYPRWEEDIEELEKYHFANKDTAVTKLVYLRMLDGVRIKQQLFCNDRTHPSIVTLDTLQLSYPDWEIDYQAALDGLVAGEVFGKFVDKMREKQRVHEGDRTHWRLRALDALTPLAYPGWQGDVDEATNFHLNRDNGSLSKMLFVKMLEGMINKQRLCGGLRSVRSHANASSSSNGSNSETSPSARVSNERGDDAMHGRSMDGSVGARNSHRNSSGNRNPDGNANGNHVMASLVDDLISIVSSRDVSRTTLEHLDQESWQEGDAPVKVDENDDNNPDARKVCLVCMTNTTTHAFVPCGHFCVCEDCGVQCMNRTTTCPVCRQEADRVMQIYFT